MTARTHQLADIEDLRIESAREPLGAGDASGVPLSAGEPPALHESGRDDVSSEQQIVGVTDSKCMKVAARAARSAMSIAAILFVSCAIAISDTLQASAEPAEQKPAADTTSGNTGAVRHDKQAQKEIKPPTQSKQIVLEQYQPDMPEAPGKRTFMVRCMVCHSARYVTMQPDFPAKAWEKVVEKMIKNFKAHISPSEAKEIVEYLVSIKGKKEAPPQ